MQRERKILMGDVQGVIGNGRNKMRNSFYGTDKRNRYFDASKWEGKGYCAWQQLIGNG